MVQVLICDDQVISRQLFEMIVNASENYTLVKALESAKVADIYCSGGNVDLILMDLVMNDMNGLDAAAMIKRKYPKIKIIIVTSMPDAAFIERARRIGVDSFWYKEVQDAPLLDVMDRTMAGESVYPDSAPVIQLGFAESTEFTERELDTLRNLVSGLSDREIAERLGISYNTVRVYISNMLQKTGYSSRTELAVKAAKSGIVVPE